MLTTVTRQFTISAFFLGLSLSVMGFMGPVANATQESFRRHLPDNQIPALDLSNLDISSLQSYADLSMNPRDSGYAEKALKFISSLTLVDVNPDSFDKELSELDQSEQTVVDDFLTQEEIDSASISDAISISTLPDEVCLTGQCEHADPRHRDALDSYGTTNEELTLISIPEIGIVGSLKWIVENSMLALRNVVNSKGQLVLIRGAIYSIDWNTFNRACAGQPLVLNVAKLIVRPNRFLQPRLFNRRYVMSLNKTRREYLREEWQDTKFILIERLAKIERCRSSLITSPSRQML